MCHVGASQRPRQAACQSDEAGTAHSADMGRGDNQGVSRLKAAVGRGASCFRELGSVSNIILNSHHDVPAASGWAPRLELSELIDVRLSAEARLEKLTDSEWSEAKRLGPGPLGCRQRKALRSQSVRSGAMASCRSSLSSVARSSPWMTREP